MHNIGLSSSGLAVDVLGAASFGNWTEVRGALARGFDPVTSVDRRGLTLLHFAAGNAGGRHCLPLVCLCLERGADVNARGLDGTTPLHWAAQEGSAAVCEALLAAGADPGAVSNDGRSILCEVVRFGGVGDAPERTRVLLAHPGLDVCSVYKGWSPEQWAWEKQLPVLAAMIAEEVRASVGVQSSLVPPGP